MSRFVMSLPAPEVERAVRIHAPRRMSTRARLEPDVPAEFMKAELASHVAHDLIDRYPPTMAAVRSEGRNVRDLVLELRIFTDAQLHAYTERVMCEAITAHMRGTAR